MAFTTSSQETECALFLQPRSPHGANTPQNSLHCVILTFGYELRANSAPRTNLHTVICNSDNPILLTSSSYLKVKLTHCVVSQSVSSSLLYEVTSKVSSKQFVHFQLSWLSYSYKLVKMCLCVCRHPSRC